MPPPRRMGRARVRSVLELGHGLGRSPEPVGDGVSRDGVEPRRSAAARRVVRSGGAPDGDECVLHRVLGPAAIAEASQRERENRPRVATVELVERAAISVRDADDQLPVRRLWELHRSNDSRFRAG